MDKLTKGVTRLQESIGCAFTPIAGCRADLAEQLSENARQAEARARADEARSRADERSRQLDERIDKLVSATGEFLRRGGRLEPPPAGI